MDPNRTYLLAQNRIPGEYIVSYPSIARTPPSQPRSRARNETVKSRESVESLDEIAGEKEEAQVAQSHRSGARAVLAKATRWFSGEPKEKSRLGAESQEKGDIGGGQRPIEAEEKPGEEDRRRDKELMARLEPAKNHCELPRASRHCETIEGEGKDEEKSM